jgi:hypothetical protein
VVSGVTDLVRRSIGEKAEFETVLAAVYRTRFPGQ